MKRKILLIAHHIRVEAAQRLHLYGEEKREGSRGDNKGRKEKKAL